LTYFA